MFLFHPPLSSIPIGALLLLLLVELVSLVTKRKIGTEFSYYLLTFFAIAVVLAFLSGYQASEYANQTFEIPDEVIVRHHTFGRLLLFAVIPCLVLRVVKDRAAHAKVFFNISYWCFLILCCGLLLTTGYLGGELVFRYGAGVYATK